MSNEHEGLYGWSAFLALSGIALIILLSSLDQTIISTALPRIIADLDGFHLYPWVATSYLLTLTISIPLFGKLGDLYGRKPFILASVCVFVGASMVAGVAWSMVVLILARAVQGVGAGMFWAAAFTSVGDIFPQPERRARWQGLLSGTFGFSSMVGPSLGGVMTDTLGWRSVFYINVPVGVLALFVIWTSLPAELSPRQEHRKIDWAGAVTMMLGMIGLLLAIEWGGRMVPWNSVLMMVLIASSVLLFTAFSVIEYRSSEPLIPLDMVVQREMILYSLLSFLLGFMMFGLVFYTPLFLQGVMGLSASASGAVQTPLVVSIAVGGLFSGQVFSITGQSRVLMLSGASLLMVGTLLLSQATMDISRVVFGVELALCGVGAGLILPLLPVLVQALVPRSRLGVGTSLIRFVRFVGSTIGNAVVGAIVASMFATRLNAAMPAGIDSRMASVLRDPQTLVSPDALVWLQVQAFRQGIVGLLQLRQGLAASRAALASGVQTGYGLTFAGAVLCVVLILALHTRAGANVERTC